MWSLIQYHSFEEEAGRDGEGWGKAKRMRDENEKNERGWGTMKKEGKVSRGGRCGSRALSPPNSRHVRNIQQFKLNKIIN